VQTNRYRYREGDNKLSTPTLNIYFGGRFPRPNVEADILPVIDS
jgi:hypothetical protein